MCQTIIKKLTENSENSPHHRNTCTIPETVCVDGAREVKAGFKKIRTECLLLISFAVNVDYIRDRDCSEAIDEIINLPHQTIIHGDEKEMIKNKPD